MTSRLWRVAACFAATALTLASAGTALAHAYPKTTDPQPNARLDGAPAHIGITYDSAIDARGSPTSTQQQAPAATTGSKPATCVDNGVVTPGQADFRVNTYCKRQTIREQYKGKINELVFNFDLSIGMGLENSLKDAMAATAGG